MSFMEFAEGLLFGLNPQAYRAYKAGQEWEDEKELRDLAKAHKKQQYQDEAADRKAWAETPTTKWQTNEMMGLPIPNEVLPGNEGYLEDVINRATQKTDTGYSPIAPGAAVESSKQVDIPLPERLRNYAGKTPVKSSSLSAVVQAKQLEEAEQNRYFKVKDELSRLVNSVEPAEREKVLIEAYKRFPDLKQFGFTVDNLQERDIWTKDANGLGTIIGGGGLPHPQLLQPSGNGETWRDERTLPNGDTVQRSSKGKISVEKTGNRDDDDERKYRNWERKQRFSEHQKSVNAYEKDKKKLSDEYWKQAREAGDLVTIEKDPKTGKNVVKPVPGKEGSRDFVHQLNTWYNTSARELEEQYKDIWNFDDGGETAGGETSSSGAPQNNPLNIKHGNGTKQYVEQGVATVGRKATDGGNFLDFKTPQAGVEAAYRLLTGPAYKNLTVDAAMRKWSNKGYNGDIAPSIKDKKIADLNQQELFGLMGEMIKREGNGSSSPGKTATAQKGSPKGAASNGNQEVKIQVNKTTGKARAVFPDGTIKDVEIGADGKVRFLS